MKNYIAFFDILGFKEYILNNTNGYVALHFDNNIRESQLAITNGKTKEYQPGILMADLSLAKVNCLQVSDSIIFWTDGGTTEENFTNIVDVCYTFNWRSMKTTFPVRGCLVAGELNFQPFNLEGQKGITFYNSSLYGRGLTEAYLKAENQDWAGCYIHESAVKTVDDKIICDLIYDKKVAYYPIPLKDGTNSYEHAIRIGHGINNTGFRNGAKEIENLFKQHMNGKPIDDSVRRKMNNTIKFLDYFRNEEKENAKE